MVQRSARVVLVVVVSLAAVLLGLAGVQGQAQAAPHVVGHGSARQAYATGLPAHATVSLVRAGRQVQRRRADAQGGVLFRDLRPASGYRMVVGRTRSAAFTVHTAAAKPWHTDFYHQRIADNGYGYLTTRDGTKLAISVHPPTSAAGLGVGVAVPNFAPPYPTLIEYAGYGYADPKDPQNGIATLANLMGFAVVDVNMRGTGCSGGAYDFFERNQQLDAYDVIETIAHQPWVKGHKVGMMGISYGAISQLFSAALNPPDLSAIAPLSTIDSVATTLYPGGILNNGFAVAWAKERIHDALPASAHGGQAYAWKRVQDGDAVCKADQDLHGEAVNLMRKIRANRHYKPKTADPLDPITFVDKIHVPVFLACQFTDEQTGGHCPALVKHFTGTRRKWFTFTNGVHGDSLDPETFNRWYDFLELYVAHQAPVLNSVFVRATAPLIYQTAFGLPHTDLTMLPGDPVQGQLTYAAALKRFDALPMVRVDFDNGAGKGAGEPFSGYEKTFSAFPPTQTRAMSLYLGKGGAMSSHRQSGGGMDRYTSDPGAVPKIDFTGSPMAGGLWGNKSQWSWDWKDDPSGTAVSYLSPRLTKDLTVVGGGAVQVWVRSSTPDVDLQATVSEVTPAGNEVFVQNGWQRASERRLSYDPHDIFREASTLLEPVPSLKQSDVRPMPRGRFVKVTIPLYYEGHAYRAGSRIRLTISGVNGSQPVWSFDETEPPTGTARVAIAHSRSMPSRLILPAIPGESIPTKLPACGVLRNEPCRPYVALPNHSAPLS
ncbi:MAG: CocE/NonD family hydrolase [Nocardioidaceae bacterium]|nr:CocE/NonD family hydrolase [Nocardioidaceae bacterium]MCL2613535.1 CocE/NonD family hydrolase [Nocardioidaceae bacterium]